jgi:GntR family transcriptional regulator
LGAKEIQLKLDFHSGMPIYTQITEHIRHQIASGALHQGDQLPTVRQLATDLRVNWNTVARAYRLLDEAGLISTQQGRGTYIWEAPSETTTRELRHKALESLTRRYLVEAARLGCLPEEVLADFQQNLQIWQEAGAPPAQEPER